MSMIRLILISCLAGLLSCAVEAEVGGPVGGTAYKYPGPSQNRGSVIDYVQSLGFLKKYAEMLERSHAARIPEARPPLQQIQSDATFLQQKWLAWPHSHPGRSLLWQCGVRPMPSRP
jgi:hypothetical protein